jgi:hypothetical protein
VDTESPLTGFTELVATAAVVEDAGRLLSVEFAGLAATSPT